MADTLPDLEFTEVDVTPALAVQVPGQCGPTPQAVGAAMGPAFDTLGSYLTRHGLAPTGPPRAIYTAFGPEGVTFVVAMPVASAGPEEPPVKVDTLPGVARAYRFTHRGPYPKLAETYGRIGEFLKEKGWMTSEADWAKYMPMWEEYLNDPHSTPEADLVTYIYLPSSAA